MSAEKKTPEEESGFKVTDKRHFTPEGETIEGRDAAPEERSEPAPPPPPPPAGEKEKKPGFEQARGEAPPEAVDFSHLIMSLAGTAYHALGVPDPVTKEKGIVNLQAASQMIDLLGVLEEKTRGNLTPQEEQILRSILTELRSLFVQTSGFNA